MTFLNKKTFLGNYKLLILDVVHSYVEYLEIICQVILINPDTKEKHEIKYEQVKEDFFTFLVEHKRFFKLSNFQNISDDKSVVDSVFINYHEGLDQFMELKRLTEHTKKLEAVLLRNPSAELKNSYDLVLINKEVIKVINRVIKKKVVKNKFLKKIKTKVKKQEISEKNLKKFFDNHFLVKHDRLNTNCCNYTELQAFIKKCSHDYINSEVN